MEIHFDPRKSNFYIHLLFNKLVTVILLFLFCVMILYKIKMNVDELINKLQNILNKLISENDLSIKTTELSNELLETIKKIENCNSCEDKKIDLDKTESYLAKLGKKSL